MLVALLLSSTLFTSITYSKVIIANSTSLPIDIKKAVEPFYQYETNYVPPFVDSPKSIKISTNSTQNKLRKDRYNNQQNDIVKVFKVNCTDVSKNKSEEYVSNRLKNQLYIDVPSFRLRGNERRKHRKNSRNDGFYATTETSDKVTGLSKLVASTQDLISNEDLLEINDAAEKEVLDNEEPIKPRLKDKKEEESRKVFQVFNEKDNIKTDNVRGSSKFTTRERINRNHKQQKKDSNDLNFAKPIIVKDDMIKSIDEQFKTNFAATIAPYLAAGYELTGLKDIEIKMFDKNKQKDISHVLLSPITVGLQLANSNQSNLIDLKNINSISHMFAGSNNKFVRNDDSTIVEVQKSVDLSDANHLNEDTEPRSHFKNIEAQDNDFEEDMETFAGRLYDPNQAEESKKYERKEYGFPNSDDFGERIIQPIIIEKEVPITKYVDRYIEKQVPYPTPYEVVKEVPVEKHVPYPVPVEKIVEKPIQVTKYVDRMHPVEVKVPHPVPYEVKVPYPVERQVYVEKKIPVPVEVEKKVVQKVPVPTPFAVPYEVKVPVERPVLYPIPINQPYAVPIPFEKEVERIVEKRVPYPVPVEKRVPYPVTVEKRVPYPVERIVERPVTVTKYVEKNVPVNVHVPVPVPQPYPVDRYIEKKVPYPVHIDRYVQREVKVPVTVPYPVEKVVEKVVPQYINRPYPVEKHVPYPVPVDRIVEKKVPVPVQVRVPYMVPYAVEKIVEKPVPYAVKVPYPVDSRENQSQLSYMNNNYSLPPTYSSNFLSNYIKNNYNPNSSPHYLNHRQPQTQQSNNNFQYEPLLLQNKNKDIRDIYGTQNIKTTQWGNTYASSYQYTTPKSSYFKSTENLSNYLDYITNNLENLNSTQMYPTTTDVTYDSYYPETSNEFDSFEYNLHPFRLTKFKRKNDRSMKLLKNVRVEYGGFRPPMIPSLEVDLNGVPVHQHRK